MLNVLNASTTAQPDLPLVTVICVTFNAGKFLNQCIDSVYNQSYPNKELIIIDGGSTDNTVQILQENSHKIDFWKTEPDKGIYDAMNKAINYANGDWILFLGADDTLLKGFSEMCLLLKDKNCIYYGESQWKHVIHGGIFTPYRLAKFNICHQNIFYPKSVFKHYKYDLKYKVCADYLLNIQCFTNKLFKFEFHPILVSIYASGGFSSQVVDDNFLRDKDMIIKKHFGKGVYLRYKLRKFRHFITRKTSNDKDSI